MIHGPAWTPLQDLERPDLPWLRRQAWLFHPQHAASIVQAAASYGFVETYSHFVEPLSEEEQSKAFHEAKASHRLYGATGAPGSLAEWRAMLAEFTPTLQSSDVVEEFLAVLKAADVDTGAPKALQDVLIRAAFEIIPVALRRKLGLETQRISAFEHAAVKLAARAADRIPSRTAPPVQVCLRLGLDPGYLYPCRSASRPARSPEVARGAPA